VRALTVSSSQDSPWSATKNEFEAGLREVSGAYTDPDSLPDIIASILAFTGRLDQAAKLARHATRADSRSHQLIFVATAMARLGKKQDYELTMQAAEKETADAIAAFPDDKENDLLSLAGAQVRSGDFDRAEELADRLSAADGASIHASVARKSALRSDQARYKKSDGPRDRDGFNRAIGGKSTTGI